MKESPEQQPKKMGRPRKTDEEKNATKKAKYEEYRNLGYYIRGSKYSYKPLSPNPNGRPRADDSIATPAVVTKRVLMRNLYNSRKVK